MFCWPCIPYNLFQMKPTRCTLLLSIFISTYLCVSSNYVSIIRRTYCICLVCWWGWSLSQLADQTATHTQWKLPVSHRYSKFSWWRALSCPKYTGCNRRNGPDFGRVFLMLYYTDITQNTYVQSRTVTEIIGREKCGLHRSRRTIRRPWRHTCPMRLPNNETL